MPVGPKDFLTCASFLLGAGLREADYRSSVSRAYYATFSMVKKKSEALVSYQGSSEHSIALQFVWDRWPDLYDDFATLQERRIESDYRLSATVSKGRAAHVYTLAQEFLTALQKR